MTEEILFYYKDNGNYKERKEEYRQKENGKKDDKRTTK